MRAASTSTSPSCRAACALIMKYRSEATFRYGRRSSAGNRRSAWPRICRRASSSSTARTRATQSSSVDSPAALAADLEVIDGNDPVSKRHLKLVGADGDLVETEVSDIVDSIA